MNFRESQLPFGLHLLFWSWWCSALIFIMITMGNWVPWRKDMMIEIVVMYFFFILIHYIVDAFTQFDKSATMIFFELFKFTILQVTIDFNSMVCILLFENRNRSNCNSWILFLKAFHVFDLPVLHIKLFAYLFKLSFLWNFAQSCFHSIVIYFL